MNWRTWFANWNAIWAGLAMVPLVCWFLWRSWRKRQSMVRLFVSERLMDELLEGVSMQRQKIKMILLAGAFFFLMLALARPQWGFVWEEANQRGRDILIAVDTSRSMLAEDMAPNRLTRAKLASLDLLRMARQDRLGLIAFAGAAFLQCPLTLDDEAFRQNVAALDTSIIPQGGTALTEAIDTAMSTFAAEEGDNDRALIIFTDGEDHETGAVAAAQNAADHNMKVFTVGVGTPNGEVLRITDENGRTNFVRDASGNVVKSKLDEDLLRQIATKGNGFYVALREGNAMQALYQRGLEPMHKSDIASKLVKHLNEQFHWPLGIAIALLLIEALLPAAPRRRILAKPSIKAEAAGVALILLCLSLPVEASPARAYRDYKEGHFKDARNEYERLLEKKPDDPQLNYNAGAAAYKAGAFEAAAKDFNTATKAEDLNLQEKAYYNLGNTNFQIGNEQSESDKKMALWHEAVQNYESALKLNPKDADAAFNRDVVKKELEKLKEQQKQEKNDNKDQNKKEQDKQDQDKQQQQKQDQQKKDNKDDKQDQQQQKDNQDQKSDEQKKEEEKRKQQEKQQQEEQKKQQQQQANEQKKDQKGEEKKDSPQPGEKNEANQDQEKKQEAEDEARAAKMAQMTPKQAQQMLDAQKSQEKALIYRMQAERKKSHDRVFKDW